MYVQSDQWQGKVTKSVLLFQRDPPCQLCIQQQTSSRVIDAGSCRLPSHLNLDLDPTITSTSLESTVPCGSSQCTESKNSANTVKMILSPYHNPPYRTPSHNATTRPPHDRSPKRKRINSERPSTPLQIDTTARHDVACDAGADSPRTRVAASLLGLRLQPQESPEVVITHHECTGAPRKRQKQNPPLRNPLSGEPDVDAGALMRSTPERSSQPAI